MCQLIYRLNMFWITYIYFNFVPIPKPGMQLYFQRKTWEIFKQLFERKKERNFVSCRYIFVKQVSNVNKEVGCERVALGPKKKKK